MWMRIVRILHLWELIRETQETTSVLEMFEVELSPTQEVLLREPARRPLRSWTWQTSELATGGLPAQEEVTAFHGPSSRAVCGRIPNQDSRGSRSYRSQLRASVLLTRLCEPT
jgi:hypothetical protein